ncbi:MAG: biopolymer transporter ExbD [Alphaproteobacteria bacterium]|nr:biopolymer transporter ExbD [Alphaproteobacteria bacterium]
MNFRATRREPAQVDLTPLIDIIFQLVLFFMVSTTFIAAPGIQVDLPRSSAQTILQDQEDISIWMSEKGEIFVDEKPVTWDDLVAALNRAAERDPSTMVIIKADTAVGHGRVVAVMDLARSKGLTRLAIGTDAEAGRAGTEPEPED